MEFTEIQFSQTFLSSWNENKTSKKLANQTSFLSGKEALIVAIQNSLLLIHEAMVAANSTA